MRGKNGFGKKHRVNQIQQKFVVAGVGSLILFGLGGGITTTLVNAQDMTVTSPTKPVVKHNKQPLDTNSTMQAEGTVQTKSKQTNKSAVKTDNSWMPDPILRAAVIKEIKSERTELDINESNLKENMGNFTSLNVGDEYDLDSVGVSNLTGLEYATNLNSLSLYNTKLFTNGIDGLKSVSKLKNLQYFAINGDKSISMPLISFIDTYLADKTNLKWLNLLNVKLTGQMPSFGNYKKLESLTLDNLPLNGSIPDFSGNKKLVSLDLQNDGLTGKLPDFSKNSLSAALVLVGNGLTTGVINDNNFY